MNMADDDPLLGLGLQPVRLAHQATFDAYFQTLSEPLSDYTFAQVFTWGNSLRIAWKLIRDHLCIFANGTGDLSLLMPPIGEGNSDRALAEAFEIMDAYNEAHDASGHSRVEYASEELLGRFDRSRLAIAPMGPDYLYDSTRMIDLAGGDLASKRQLKNRFLRNYQHRVEAYDPARHHETCLELLRLWKAQQDANPQEQQPAAAIKRQKEARACELALAHAQELGLKGMVVYVQPAAGEPCELRGFTLGEYLGKDQSSIIIEKTDLSVRGLAQFIFSEFCKANWSERPLVNAGDDWGLETLAWTKMSYRPAKLLQKYELRLAKPVQVSMPIGGRDLVETAAASTPIAEEPMVRSARREDLSDALKLEQTCFDAFCLSKRQLSYLQGRPSSLFLVAEHGGHIVGQGISLVRRHKRSMSGRIYSLAVDSAHRRHKIGQRLLRAMMDGLIGRGVKRIYLEVEQSNTAAIKLYERHGFREEDLIENYYGPGRAARHMVWEAPAADKVGS